MRGKMHRALIRAINTGCLGFVSATGDLGNRSNGVLRGQVRQFPLRRDYFQQTGTYVSSDISAIGTNSVIHLEVKRKKGILR